MENVLPVLLVLLCCCCQQVEMLLLFLAPNCGYTTSTVPTDPASYWFKILGTYVVPGSKYKDRAAPPIGGPALHDSGVKTVQWRKRECHDSYQEVEVYLVHNIYILYLSLIHI